MLNLLSVIMMLILILGVSILCKAVLVHVLSLGILYILKIFIATTFVWSFKYSLVIGLGIEVARWLCRDIKIIRNRNK